MSNTDSPSNSHNDRSSCSLVNSLFSTSCRGRAEAFARSLHRRLTSLSGETNADEDAPAESTEKTWLSSTPTIKTTEPTSSNNVPSNRDPFNQKQYLSNHLRNNFYYDVDTQLDEDIGSPAEEEPPEEAEKWSAVSALPINEESSSDYEKNDDKVAKVTDETSPSEESEMYFDLLSSSDAEKRNDKFFDVLSPSESDTSSRIPNHTSLVNFYSKDEVPNRISTDESSDSIYPYRIDQTQAMQNTGLHLDNSKSSTDTTSPSHESLWSDDSTTLSIPENSSSMKMDVSYDNINARIIKSFSDSQICTRIKSEFPMNNLLGNNVDKVNDSTKKSLSENDMYKCVQSINEREFKCDELNFLNQVEHLNLHCRLPTNKTIEIVNTQATFYYQEAKIDRENSADSEPTMDNTNDEMSSNIDNHDDDYDDDEQHPPRIRRCSSLKSGKTPPGTPGRKKIVRFADVLGLDLADVRTFLDEIPKIPNSAYSDLIYDDSFEKDTSPSRNGVQSWSLSYTEFAGSHGTEINASLDRLLVPLFQQPASLTTFLDILREKYVTLENASVQDMKTLCVHGTVRVLNLDFHKSVHIRYTLNSWCNYSDLQATYIPNSCDGLSDKFSFILYGHTLSVGQRLEFAVRFQCKGMQYWDNNNGVNYCFQCMPANTSTNYTSSDKSPSAIVKQWGDLFY